MEILVTENSDATKTNQFKSSILSHKHIIKARKNKDTSLFQSFAPLQLVKDKKKDDVLSINISSENN